MRHSLRFSSPFCRSHWWRSFRLSSSLESVTLRAFVVVVVVVVAIPRVPSREQCAIVEHFFDAWAAETIAGLAKKKQWVLNLGWLFSVSHGGPLCGCVALRSFCFGVEEESRSSVSCVLGRSVGRWPSLRSEDFWLRSDGRGGWW